MDGKQKALIFLSSLGNEAARRIIAALPPVMADQINKSLAEFPAPTEGDIKKIYQELAHIALPVAAEAKRLPDTKAEVSEVKELSPLEQLNRFSPKQLLLALQDEQPQMIAFIMNHLKSPLSDNYLQLLSPGRRSDIERKKVLPFEEISEKIFGAINNTLLAVEV